MDFKIKSETEKGTKGLKDMIKESDTRKARMFYDVVITEQNPFTIIFAFKKIPKAFGHDEIILKTLISGLREQLFKEYGLTEKDINIEVA